MRKCYLNFSLIKKIQKYLENYKYLGLEQYDILTVYIQI